MEIIHVFPESTVYSIEDADADNIKGMEEFVKQRCILKPGAYCNAAELYEAFISNVHFTLLAPCVLFAFIQNLPDVQSYKIQNTYFCSFLGITLKPTEHDSDNDSDTTYTPSEKSYHSEDEED